MNYVGLTLKEYVKILENIHTSRMSNGILIYWFHDRQTKKNITVATQEKNYYRVTYREIVLISQIFLDQLKNDYEKANTVAKSLQEMTERKLSHKSAWNPLSFNVYEFLQCCFFYNEGGFRSSTSIANELIRTLKEVQKIEKDDQKYSQRKILENSEKSLNTFTKLPETPTSTCHNEPQTNLRVVKTNERIQSNQTTRTEQVGISNGSLKSRKEKYAISCSNLEQDMRPFIYREQKTVERFSSSNSLNTYAREKTSNGILCLQVFDKLKEFDLKTSKERYVSELNKIRCLVDYLRYLSGSYTIDLNKTTCIKLILDGLQYYSVDNQLRLIDWLIQQETLSKELVCLCSERIVYRYNNLSQTNSFAAVKLLEIYQKKFYCNGSEFDLRVLNLAATMVGNPERDSDLTLKSFIEWIIKQNEFSFETFDILIETLVDKGINDSNTHGIILINKLKEEPQWIQEYQNSLEAQSNKYLLFNKHRIF